MGFEMQPTNSADLVRAARHGMISCALTFRLVGDRKAVLSRDIESRSSDNGTRFLTLGVEKWTKHKGYFQISEISLSYFIQSR